MTNWRSGSASSSGRRWGRRPAAHHDRSLAGNWFLELDGGSRFVVRVEQGGVFGTSGTDEFEFMQAVGRLGFPVARVRWLDPSGEVIGQPFFVMDWVEAARPASPRTSPRGSCFDLLRRLDELHQLEWQGMLDGPGPTGRRTCRSIGGKASIAGRRRFRSRCSTRRRPGCVPMPRSSPGSRSSTATPAPATSSTTSRVVAFTDLEFSHLGDPAEDWSSSCDARAPHDAMDEWEAVVRDVAGVELAETERRYWGAFNFFKGACANRSCRVFAGANPAPNMALIGTALHQTFMRQLADLVGQRSGSSTGESISSRPGS